MKRYAVHPGYIKSKNDNDEHFISADQLVRLYRLKPNEYVIWDDRDPKSFRAMNEKDFVHLYPDYNGNYTKPPLD